MQKYNNTIEEWKRWEPLETLEGKYFIDDFYFFEGGLKIKLFASKGSERIELFFPYGVAAYRYTNESWCFTIFGDLSKMYGGSFYTKWSFFTIENSDYVKSLSLTSVRMSESTHFYHFAILGNDEIIDILSTYRPTATMIS